MRDKHQLARKTVTVNLKGKPYENLVDGCKYTVEDWVENVMGGSWGVQQGNPACLIYAMRSAMAGIGIDEEVVYGKVNGIGYLVHVSELGDEVKNAK